MKNTRTSSFSALILTGTVLLCVRSATAANEPAAPISKPTAPRAVDVRAPDGTILKGSYFPAAGPGPGMLLFHQSNRARESWDDVARRLAAAGIHTLTIDMRGHGETGGAYDNWTDPNRDEAKRKWAADIDAAFQYLASQPGVQRGVIGAGGAGLLGVDNSVETARQHPAEVKSLALLSGETFRPGLEFLRQSPQLPILFAVDDQDEYPPTHEAVELLYITASNPGRKFVHYSSTQDAPWAWYEPVDVGRVPAAGRHGTDMFQTHPELPGIIVDWFVTTLIRTPGHAPAETVASAPVLNQIAMPGGAAPVRQQLTEARRKDPQAQLFPEVTASIIGWDYGRAHDTKSALEVAELVVLAYPNSADAHESVAEAYLDDGQKDLARQHAEKSLALLDSRAFPASSWADTEPYRGHVRRAAESVVKKISEGAVAARTPDAPSLPSTVASAIDREISNAEKEVFEAADAMPEDKFDFTPEALKISGSDFKGVRTFAIQVKHIAASNYFIWSPLTGEKLPEGLKDGNGPENLKRKAEILQFLKDSFALGHRAAATLTAENMLQTVGKSRSPRLGLATFGVAHAFDHYGQMVEYLRMNGIVPPASRGRSD
ncbi:MAG TPA: DinB family protein [Thermoanaerobaculia bacterium]